MLVVHYEQYTVTLLEFDTEEKFREYKEAYAFHNPEADFIRVEPRSRLRPKPHFMNPNSVWECHEYLAEFKRVMQADANTWLNQKQAQAAWDFAHPYACSIHDSGKGFYIDRQYNPIATVLDIVRPGSKNADHPREITRYLKHETELKHCLVNRPAWADQFPTEEFTTFWHY